MKFITLEGVVGIAFYHAGVMHITDQTSTQYIVNVDRIAVIQQTEIDSVDYVVLYVNGTDRPFFITTSFDELISMMDKVLNGRLLIEP